MCYLLGEWPVTMHSYTWLSVKQLRGAWWDMVMWHRSGSLLIVSGSAIGRQHYRHSMVKGAWYRKRQDGYISMAQCKKDVTPLLMHWSYVFLALSHRYTANYNFSTQTLTINRGWVGLWGFLWWAPSAKRKDHHGVRSGWSSVWHRSNTGLSSTQYE